MFFLVSLCFSKMFSVQLSLGEQTWESEGSSIKKAQQAVANKALTESTLPKPVQKPPKSNVNNNPGMALTWFPVFLSSARAVPCVFLHAGLLHSQWVFRQQNSN